MPARSTAALTACPPRVAAMGHVEGAFQSWRGGCGRWKRSRRWSWEAPVLGSVRPPRCRSAGDRTGSSRRSSPSRCARWCREKRFRSSGSRRTGENL
jgi:hypothetical protein